MSAHEPSQWPPSGGDHVAEPEGAPSIEPQPDLRVGYDDGLVQHPLARVAGRNATPPKRRMRATGRFILLIVVVGLAWTAWAAAAFYELTIGLHEADPVTLERRIDWDSVRRGLREDLQAAAISAAGERSIDELVSEPAIANLLRTVKLDDRGWDTAAQPAADDASDFEWYRIRYAFFSGSPFTYRVDIRPDSSTIRQPLVLLFRWTGDWRLVRVFLPSRDAARSSLASHGPSSAAGPAARVAPAAPSADGTQRATLYEEDSKEPQGKLYNGSVTWRTEHAPPVAGGASSLAVVAQVGIPTRPLTVTIAIRRNLDQSLPASHTIEVNFELPANSPSLGVQDMVGIMMKPNEEAPGQNLAGTRVKVRDGLFLLGLSAIDLDVRHNMQVLSDRSWFGIPFRYGNGNRAVLVIEKGATGEKSLTEAFEQWRTAAAAEAGANKK